MLTFCYSLTMYRIPIVPGPQWEEITHPAWVTIILLGSPNSETFSYIYFSAIGALEEVIITQSGSMFDKSFFRMSINVLQAFNNLPIGFL